MNFYDPNRHKWIAFIFGVALIPISINIFFDTYRIIRLECNAAGDCIFVSTGLMTSNEHRFRRLDIKSLQSGIIGKQGLCLSIDTFYQGSAYVVCVNKHTAEQLNQIVEAYNKTGTFSFIEDQKDWYRFFWFGLTLFGIGMTFEVFRKPKIEE